MFSKMVRDAIKKQIPECNEYLLTDVISRMQQIFDAHGIKEEVKYPTIQKYYGADKLKAKDKQGWIKLWKFQPNLELE